MKAYQIHHFGGPEALQESEVEIPALSDGEVCVKVHAASINPVDFKTRSGEYPAVQADKLPLTLGRDFAGIVDTSESPLWQVGDKVFGFVGQGQGALAEYVKVHADALAALPRTIGNAGAAAVALAGLTAWQGIFDHGQLKAGQRILIHAAAGGVGHLAVQFAKWQGAYVYATASADSMEFVRSLGADHVIDYKKERFEDVVGDVDVVFDTMGGETQQRSWGVLKQGGALVSTLSEPSQDEAGRREVRAMRYTARPDGKQLTEIGHLMDEGKVRVEIVETYDFAVVPAALARVEAGHVHGKVVVTTSVT